MANNGSSEARPRRRVWPEAEKRRLVAEVESQGLPISTVARTHQVHPSLLTRWCHEFAEAPSPAFATVNLTPIEPPSRSDTEAAAPKAVIEVVLPNGRRLVAAEEISAARLRSLVAALA